LSFTESQSPETTRDFRTATLVETLMPARVE